MTERVNTGTFPGGQPTAGLCCWPGGVGAAGLWELVQALKGAKSLPELGSQPPWTLASGQGKILQGGGGAGPVTGLGRHR